MRVAVTCATAQACAKQCLGLLPATIPPCYQDPYCKNTWDYMFKPDFSFTWNPDFAHNQWWIDAFTVDPSKLILDMKGLWEHGTPQPVVSTRLENASLGTLPKIMVYMAVHPEFGSHVWFPYHGAKHGSGDREADTHMYADFHFWHHDVEGDLLERLKSMRYHNVARGLAAFDETASAAVKQLMKDGPFNPDFFMVCTI